MLVVRGGARSEGGDARSEGVVLVVRGGARREGVLVCVRRPSVSVARLCQSLSLSLSLALSLARSGEARQCCQYQYQLWVRD